MEHSGNTRKELAPHLAARVACAPAVFHLDSQRFHSKCPKMSENVSFSGVFSPGDSLVALECDNWSLPAVRDSLHRENTNMIISTPNLVAILAAGDALLGAGPGRSARGPLTLPSPPPRRPWLWHEEQSAGERGECAPRPAHLPTSGPTTIKLTALLTHLLTHAPSISTPNSTPNRTICARSSRA